MSKQTVTVVLQPGNVWVVENAVENNEETDAALKTCYMRGWIEPLEKAVPIGTLTPEGKLPENLFDRVGTIYRLTDSGWAVVNRAHQIRLIGVFLAILTIFLAIV